MAIHARTLDSVEIWRIRTDAPAHHLAGLASLLDKQEQQRAASIRDPRARARFVVAHGVTRLIVADRLGTDPEAIRWRHGEHGKPELDHPASDLCINLSHSAELALVAVSVQRPVGVDVQEIGRPGDPTQLAARYFPEAEARWVAAAGRRVQRLDRFAKLWVRKEACVKAAGGRLAQGLLLPVASAGGTVLVQDPASETFRLLVSDVAAPKGFRAAVAVVGHRPYRIIARQWTPGRGPFTLTAQQ